ncbi:GNAT family N-acetyltransferase [Streptomyces sp. NBC_01498]|uniref:GNAT family N-acetyltransferase n=1 Tax=Streptomyces sp. NBC_01498 TaxID=2975870 RepID=UPI002E7B9BB5|nr:GNAT family N-acetyltransferase [Streptomyces sp. NBC_01498]WTL27624.1 GNAT family N-acetyltransferase [Streptomyces sp. NBC_01498]
MTVIVRDARPEDAGAVVRVRRAAAPYLITTEESVDFTARSANPAAKYRLLVAEDDGEVIGAAHVALLYDSGEPGRARLTPHVRPDRTGRGAGSAILRAGERHLAAEGATTVYAWVDASPASLGFAERRGYTPLRTAHYLGLDLSAARVPEPPPLPAGCALATAADLAGDPRPLFEADAEVTADEPNDTVTELDDYEDWLGHTWNHPSLDRDLSTVVTAGGRVVAFAMAYTDGATRYLSAMTGTVRAHRGRGLAKAAKIHSLRRARAAGFRDAFTNNDAENKPMLAVNAWFGYEPRTSEVRHVRHLI